MVLCLWDVDHDLCTIDRIGYVFDLWVMERGPWCMVCGQYIFVCVSLSVVSKLFTIREQWRGLCLRQILIHALSLVVP